MKHTTKYTVCAILAAVLYALSIPLSKTFVNSVPTTVMSALLYLGAGVGLFAVCGIGRALGIKTGEKPLGKGDWPFMAATVILDVGASFCLLFGLRHTLAANASLLNNFEIVATALIALTVFREAISKRLWAAIILVTVASAMLSFDGAEGLKFSYGSVFVLLAAVLWGMENNCTRRISDKSPLETVTINGFGSGLGALLTAVCTGQRFPEIKYVLFGLGIGFVSYGLSVVFYVYSQRGLGAAKTSTYYALSPFVGTLLSLVIFRQMPGLIFWPALAVMSAGAYLAATDNK